MKLDWKVYLALIVVIPLFAYFLWPNQFEPVALEVQKEPDFIGDFQANDQMEENGEILIEDRVVGAEDVAIDNVGRLYGSSVDGHIYRFGLDGLEQFADTEGRPLGLDFSEAGPLSGQLIVADAHKGLIAIDENGVITTLSTEADDLPFRFTDDVDVGRDGMIYFTDASSKYDIHHYKWDLLEAKPWGRLLKYDPVTQITETLLDNLYFANGVALAKDESYVLVVETTLYRVKRLWLKGEKAGQSEIFIDNLPGFPDGISTGADGIHWLALPSPRKAEMDRVHPYPWLKSLIVKLPEFMQPAPVSYGMTVGLDSQGKVVANYQDQGGDKIREVTSVEESGGYLYFGTLSQPLVARMPLPGSLGDSNTDDVEDNIEGAKEQKLSSSE